MPVRVKQGINVWLTAARIEKGRLFRSVKKGGEKIGGSLGDLALWAIVEQSPEKIGIEHLGAHDLRRTCAKVCRKSGGDLEQILVPAWPLVHPDDGALFGSEQEIAVAVTDSL